VRGVGFSGEAGVTLPPAISTQCMGRCRITWLQCGGRWPTSERDDGTIRVRPAHQRMHWSRHHGRSA